MFDPNLVQNDFLYFFCEHKTTFFIGMERINLWTNVFCNKYIVHKYQE